jgi:hypothetical protein
MHYILVRLWSAGTLRTHGQGPSILAAAWGSQPAAARRETWQIRSQKLCAFMK